MARFLRHAALAATAAALGFAATASHAAHVDVSLGFALPGVYGRVDLGRFPAPLLVTPRPVMVGAAIASAEPAYLWVPPEHRTHWADWCASYGACGRPVYFVDDGWYRSHVWAGAPRPWVPAYGSYPVPAPAPYPVYAPRPYYGGYGGGPVRVVYRPYGGWDRDHDHDGWRDRGEWRDHDHDHDRDGWRDHDGRGVHDPDWYRDRDGWAHHPGDDHGHDRGNEHGGWNRADHSPR